MELVLDGTPTKTAASSINEAIEQGAQHAERTGRCVIEVHVDGRQLEEEELASESLEAGANEVHLVTASRREVLHEAFAEASTTLEEINRLQQNAADHLQADETTDALRLLRDAIDGWIQVQEATVKGLAFAGIDLESVAFDGVSAIDALGRLNTQLSNMAQALRSGDTIALSDTLLYEMPDVILEWNQILGELASHVAAQPE